MTASTGAARDPEAAGRESDSAGARPPSSEQPKRPKAVIDVVELAPVLLVMIAEAAWISVLAGLVQEFSLRRPEIGIPTMLAFVFGGTVAARILGPRLGDRWPLAGLGLVVVSGMIGWLVSGTARAGLADGLATALAGHPGGWLAGLAVLRGYAHAKLPLAEGTVSRLLAIGVPGLAFVAVLGGAIVEPYRTPFLADALSSSIIFVGAAVLALAFTRLGSIGEESAVDWRRNPSWLAVTILLLVAAIAAALPMSAAAGTAISLLVGVAIGPMLVIGLISGFDRAGRRVMAFFAVVAAIMYVLLLVFGGKNILKPRITPTGPDDTGVSPAVQLVTMGLGGMMVVAAIAAVLILIAVWMRRSRPGGDPVEETRTVDRDRSTSDAPRRRRRRFGRMTDPSGAVEAYVALMTELDRHPRVRREPAETPAEHAARLRDDGLAELSLDLLAADYALARYGGVALSGPEDRRAVGRWRVLRRRLVTSSHTSGAGPD